MSRTGGRLSRQSATAGKNNKQKEHFAKVQLNLRNGIKKKSPLKWSIFDRIIEADAARHRESSNPSKHRRSHSREQSQTPHLPHGSILSDNPHPRLQGRERYSSHSSQPRQPRHLPAYTKLEPSPIPEDDLYSATPLPWQVEPEREESVATSEEESFVEHQEESASAKRRKILMKGDWVGVNILNPAQIGFATPRRDENIGRRRSLTDSHRARYSSRQRHIDSPAFTTKNGPLLIHSSEGRSPAVRPRTTDVRISIGSRVDPPGVSSNSAPKEKHRRSTNRKPSKRSLIASSDVMLLDDEDGLVPHHSDTMQGHNATSCQGVDTLEQHKKFSSPPGEPLTAALDLDQSSYGSSEIQDEDAELAEDTLDSAGKLKNLHDLDQQQIPQTSSTNGNSVQTSHTPTKTAAPLFPVKHRPPNGRLIFSSSSASIQHPAPVTSKRSALIRPGSSEVAESTLAQVGKLKPVVPSSQILDNEVWQTWLAPSYNEDDTQGNGEDYEDRSDKMERISISPGISTAHMNRREVIELTGTEVEDDPWELERPFSTGADPQIRTKGRDKTFESEQANVEVQTPIPEEEIQTEAEELTTERNESYLDTAVIAIEMPKVVAKPPLLKKQLEEDPDEIWRKFVFGDGSDEIDPMDLVSKHRISTRMERENSSDLPILAHPSASGSTQFVGHTESHRASGHFMPGPKSFASVYASQATNGNFHTSTRQGWSSQPEVEFKNYSQKKNSYSVRAFKGSAFPSSSDQPSASMTAVANSQSSNPPSEENTPPYRAHRKIIFTKPRPFAGSKSRSGPSVEEETLHIGRGLRDKREDDGTKRRRKRRRDIYSLLGTDEEDELESIEDD